MKLGRISHPSLPCLNIQCVCVCRGKHEVAGGYALTRLTTFLATLISCPGAPAKFAREGLLGDALLALAGLSAVEVERTHLTGQPFQPQSDHLLCVPSPQLNLSPALYPSPLLLLIPHPSSPPLFMFFPPGHC